MIINILTLELRKLFLVTIPLLCKIRPTWVVKKEVTVLFCIRFYMYLKTVMFTGSRFDISLAFCDVNSTVEIDDGFEVLW
jgi:hypothetical protein